MDTIKARALAEEELRVWGLIERGWRFDFDTAVRRFGLCSHKRKRISLSYEITKLNPEVEVLDTIRHEVAHALVYMLTGRRQGHNDVWKRYCLLVGANPNRCYSSVVEHPPAKYKGLCPRGHIHYTNRKRTCSCNHCDGKWNPSFIIKWSTNVTYN